MRRNFVEPGRPQMTVWCIRFAWWLSKGYKYRLTTCNTLFFHCNNGYTNAPQCLVCTYITCLIFFLSIARCDFQMLYDQLKSAASVFTTPILALLMNGYYWVKMWILFIVLPASTFFSWFGPRARKVVTTTVYGSDHCLFWNPYKTHQRRWT
jgi:hypothetical protein